MSTSTQNIEAQKNTNTEFISELPHKVTYSTEKLSQEITKIQTNCGLVIERGHSISVTPRRRNLKDLFANLQVGDLLTVATPKEAISLCNSMRYRNWKGSCRKQANDTYLVQRIK